MEPKSDDWETAFNEAASNARRKWLEAARKERAAEAAETAAKQARIAAAQARNEACSAQDALEQIVQYG